MLTRKLQGESDKQLCLSIKAELNKYDYLVGYYSLGYDKPFISARLLKHGYEPLQRQLHTDLYRIVKKVFYFALNSRMLVTVCEHLGIKGKTRVEPALWEDMKYASQKQKDIALKSCMAHCLADVVTLEKVYDRLKKNVVSISLAWKEYIVKIVNIIVLLHQVGIITQYVVIIKLWKM